MQIYRIPFDSNFYLVSDGVGLDAAIITLPSFIGNKYTSMYFLLSVVILWSAWGVGPCCFLFLGVLLHRI